LENIQGKVSIVIPTRNRSSYLQRAVDAAFSQEYENLEVIVSNNASNDDSEVVLEKIQKQYPDLIVVNHDDLLPLNKHWDSVIKEYVSGEFIMIIPDDDILVNNNYIKQSIELFDKYISIGLVFANYNVVNSSYKVTSKVNAQFDEYVSKEFLYGNYNKKLYGISGIGVSHLTTVFKKSAYLEVQGFDLECMSPDTHLWLKVLLKYDAGFVNEQVADYLVHDSNLSNTPNLDYKFSDIAIINNVKQYAIKNELLTEIVKETLVRMNLVFYRNFHHAYITNLKNSNMRYINYWKKIKFTYLVRFVFNKMLGKDYPNV
jgi:glycosyltransferase involved in cell wall biosynthesis